MKKLSTVVALSLVALLLCYYLFTMMHSCEIANQIREAGDYHYPVLTAVGKVNIGIVGMQNLAERLTYVHTPEVVENVRQHYGVIDATISKNLDFIADSYTGQQNNAIRLKSIYRELYADEQQLFALCAQPDVTNAVITTFVHNHIDPKINSMKGIIAGMEQDSQSKFAGFIQLADGDNKKMRVFSSLLIGAVLLAMGFYLHILRLKDKRERELRDAMQQVLENAQSANDAKSLFLSSMSHDIRTPMNAIIGMTAIAELNLRDSAKVKDCLGKISASSKHLLDLINDILDMSKIESGKIALSSEAFSLSEQITGLINMLQPQFQAKNLNFKASVSGIEHENIIGDTLRLNQVLINIISNAIKFTPAEGCITLQITELPSQYGGYGTYRFTVSDTGMGMAPEFLERIFDPFERAITSRVSKIEGTGLGMTIVKSIVDMMNGQITVTSQLEQGSTFEVTLHFKLQEEAESVSFDFSSLRATKALVVDDDADSCAYAAQILSDIGMCSESTCSGAEAVTKAVAAHADGSDYQMFIVDWKMPGMDGLETIRRIRTVVGDKLPVIILSAYDWSEIEAEAQDAGVTAFLSKPLFRSNLYYVINSIIMGVQTEEPAGETEPKVFAGRVLLAEDNAINMEIAAEFIKLCGGEAEMAWDGSEAVSMVTAAADGYYDLIFMDIQMPRLDGYEATRKLRQLEQQQGRSHTPIVAMSANAFAEDVDKAYEAGMDGYISKPITLGEVRQYLQRYSQQT
ncbi:response regulator [uncultured Phascolarctobacterium sp.]|uniref:response regulator n=1 Tax=Phascolarctobacterium sp. TaxID=2049039 RepID=UPI0025FE5D5F|nr:response regulator [uncultured Phascolarctobacterium sp.]